LIIIILHPAGSLKSTPNLPHELGRVRRRESVLQSFPEIVVKVSRTVVILTRFLLVGDRIELPIGVPRIGIAEDDGRLSTAATCFIL
jgi:hypothetical protein